jgi:hypothetical protein
MSEPHKEIVGRLQAESAAHKYRESSPHLTALLDDATEAVSRAERKIAELEAENRRLREALDPDTLEAAAPSAISSSPLPPEHHLSPDEQKVMHKALRASAALASLPVPVGEPKPLCWVSGYDVAYLKDRIDGLRMRAYLEPNELRVPLYTASEGMVDLLRRVQPTIRNLAESARAKGSHPSTNGIFALADEIDAALSGKGAAPSVSPTQSTTEKLGMFGHHPDPAIDFEVEVQAIEGMAAEARAGMEPPFASAGQVRERLAKAMSFRVGGDQGAVAAKALLRKIDDEFRF